MVVVSYQQLALTGYPAVPNGHAEAAAVHPVEDRHHCMVVLGYQELAKTNYHLYYCTVVEM